MAYGRRARRRARRTRRRTLSNRSIYGSKSARSQANQIAALRNRVNRIARDNRPEVKVTYGEYGNVFNNSSTSANTWSQFLYVPKNKIDGNTIQYKTFRLCGNLEYTDTFATSPGIDHQRTCTMRVIVYQMRAASNLSSPVIEDLLDVTSTGVGYELNAYKPFKAGAGRVAKILSNRVITLSDQQPIKRFDIKIRRGMINETFLMSTETDMDNSLSLAAPRGSFCVAIVASGLHWDSSFSQQVKCNLFVKIAYTDN